MEIASREEGDTTGEFSQALAIFLDVNVIVGFHMTSQKLKLKNYPSYRDFTFTMHQRS